MDPERVRRDPGKFLHLLVICPSSALHIAVRGTFPTSLSLGSADEQAGL